MNDRLPVAPSAIRDRKTADEAVVGAVVTAALDLQRPATVIDPDALDERVRVDGRNATVVDTHRVSSSRVCRRSSRCEAPK